MKYLSSIFLAVILLNLFVWYWVIFGSPSAALNIYFLNVGQGDSSLVILPGGRRILIDGGPDKSVLKELDKVLAPFDRYLDLVILSHPQLDHFAGLIPVMERYKIGAFLYSGREGEIKAWQSLVKVLEQRGIKAVTLAAGDRVVYRENVMKIISPDKSLLKEKDLNNTSIVAQLAAGGIKTLFTGDIGWAVEDHLVDRYDLEADVLKVAHHGSKYSSSPKFLDEVTPLISIIQVGKNKYGHPARATLERLLAIGSRVYRNDQEGTIHLKAQGGKINIWR